MSDERIPVDTENIWPEDVEAEEGVVVDWFVQEGATVEAGQTLCEIQVEKVGVDVPAPADGELDEIVLGDDDEFERGDALAWITPT